MTQLKTISTSLIFLLLFVPAISMGYEVDVHRSLTENAVREYVRLGGTLPINASDLNVVGDGAEHEDEGHRPLNHFYDPIHNAALNKSGAPLGLPSPLWAVDTQAQWRSAGDFAEGGLYFSGSQDYSWDRAVYDYVHGDKKRGLMALGQVLHLLEDATSPAHTRNDAHSGHWFDGDDPYETLTHGFISRVAVSPLEVPIFTTPERAIQSTAYYTNTNFFSKDTIDDFTLPQKSELVIQTVNGTMYAAAGSALLLKYEKNFDPETRKYTHIYSYPQYDSKIISSNWKVLSRKAVTNGVGLLRLFETAVADERRTNALLEKNQNTLTRLAAGDTNAVTQVFTGVHTSQYASALAAFTPNPTDTVALEAPQPVDLASYFPNIDMLGNAFAAANTPSPFVGTAPVQPLPADPATFPEQIAYTPATEPRAESLESRPNSNPMTTTFGGLTSLAYGAGVGGGGATELSSEQGGGSTNQGQTQTNNTPPPAKETSAAAGGDVPKTPTCAADETLDPTTNTCLTPLPAAPTLLPGTFTENTTLSGAYTSTEGQTITIPEGVTVTLAAGTTLTLARSTLLVVAGTLDLEGTESAPVAITTTDTTTPTYWRGITVTPTGTLSATYATLSYGGYVLAGSTDPTLPRATIHTSGTTTLTDVSITHSASTAVVHDGPTLTTTNLTVEDSHAAVEAFTPYTLTHTTIHRSGADTWVITLHTLLGTITGTVGEGNGFNAIALEPFASLLPGATAHLYPNDIAYVMVGDPTISGSLYLHSGLFVQNMPNTRWRITRSGSIFVPTEPGTAPILTSLYDNATYGEARGTAHAYGNLPDHAPTSGDWFGLFVQNVDESFVDPGVEVRFGPQQNQ